MSLLAASVTAFVIASATIPPPAPGHLPAMAASLAERLRGVVIDVPGGGEIDVGADLLDAARVQTALATIGEAGAWPVAWLVVQDLGRPDDLVMRVALDTTGEVATPDTIFLTARREWDDAGFDAAYRAARGTKPPRERQRNLVVQSFSKRTVTTFVWDLPKTGTGAQGLMALLPEGSLLRESASADLGDGARHTIAVVLERPTFVPSECSGAPGAVLDHADSAVVILYLAGEGAIEGRLDVTDRFRTEDGRVLVPRWACAPGDDDPALRSVSPAERFGEREMVRLISLEKVKTPFPGATIRLTLVDQGHGRHDTVAALAALREGRPELLRAASTTIVLPPGPDPGR